MWRAPWRSPCEAAMRPEWSRWRNWFSDVRIASQAPTSHQNQLASTSTNSTSTLLSMCVSSYRLSEWTHMCSCCSWGQVPCHWLPDVRVSSSEPRPRPGPSPQLTLSEVELLVSTEVRSTQVLRLVGGEQQQQADNSCCFTTSQLQKSCFHFHVSFYFWHLAGTHIVISTWTWCCYVVFDLLPMH